MNATEQRLYKVMSYCESELQAIDAADRDDAMDGKVNLARGARKSTLEAVLRITRGRAP